MVLSCLIYLSLSRGIAGVIQRLTSTWKGARLFMSMKSQARGGPGRREMQETTQTAGGIPPAVVIGAILCLILFSLTLFWDRICNWVSGIRERVNKSG